MFEEAAESLSAPKLPLRGPRSGIERLVPAPLVRSLPVVVLTVFSNSATQRRFAEEHQPVQTLGRDRQHKSLRVSVAVGVGARMRAGLRASNRRARHLPMRYETGLPSSVIRFRTLHASTASRRCPDELRARRQSPTIDVYRKNACSTRAC